jgi:hypothetical protein
MEVEVIDCDLNTDNDLVETVTVLVSSTSAPDGQSVLLSETAAESATFRATLPLSERAAEGTLLVAHEDVVTLTYIDADDGEGGIDVPVSTTATIDCMAPVIFAVEPTDIQTRSATITFVTNEPTTGIVHYGLTCGAFGFTTIGVRGRSEHSIRLTDLADNTTYYYAVEASDGASNTHVEDNEGACYSFTTPEIPDYFTEQFGSDNDLANMSITFTPNRSVHYYAACGAAISALPVDPTGGETLSLTDDSSAAIELSGDPVWLYGTSYNTFYVGSNGYITFTAGDGDFSESLIDHFDLPRISVLFDDFNPTDLGTVSWKETVEGVTVTWQDVPQYGTEEANTFQVQMRFDGTLVLSYLALAVTDGIAGLSKGEGTPSQFVESDLSTYTCGGTADDGVPN